MLETIVERMAARAREEPPRGRIGYLCGYVPQELIYAAGRIPVRLFESADKEAVAAGDNYMQRNSCPFARGCIGSFLGGKYADLEGVILGHTCDNIRGAAENIAHFGMARVIGHLDVPRTPGRPGNQRYFAAQLEELRGKLGALAGEEITDAQLRAAIDLFDRTRRALSAIRAGERTGGVRPRWTEFAGLLHTVMAEDPALFLDSLADIGSPDGGGHDDRPADGPDILLLASVIPRGGERVVKLVEDLGGSVADDQVCTGALFHELSVRPDPVDPDGAEGSPIEALARGYLDRPSCPRMYGLERRMEAIRDKIGRRGVDGVLYVTLKFCDSHLYEVPQVRALTTELGVPFLHVETELTDHDSGQVRTRIEAFFERITRQRAIARRAAGGADR